MYLLVFENFEIRFRIRITYSRSLFSKTIIENLAIYVCLYLQHVGSLFSDNFFVIDNFEIGFRIKYLFLRGSDFPNFF